MLRGSAKRGFDLSDCRANDPMETIDNAVSSAKISSTAFLLSEVFNLATGKAGVLNP
jgi:hypothetical protein